MNTSVEELAILFPEITEDEVRRRRETAANRAAVESVEREVQSKRDRVSYLQSEIDQANAELAEVQSRLDQIPRG